MIAQRQCHLTAYWRHDDVTRLQLGFGNEPEAIWHCASSFVDIRAGTTGTVCFAPTNRSVYIATSSDRSVKSTASTNFFW